MSRHVWIALGLVGAVLAVYAQTASFGFVEYDDAYYVQRNATVHAGLSWANVGWAFTSFYHANWHPLTWLSHMLDVELFGVEPGAHHATNVLLHTVNSLLLYALLVRLTGRSMPSAFTAALFALHPLHVESVAWISERKDVLSTCLGLLAIGAYARWVRTGGSRWYAATALCLALGLAAKPMLVTWPFVLLLLDYWPLERVGRVPLRRLLVEKLPLLAIVIASSVLTLIAQGRTEAVVGLGTATVLDRLENTIAVYVWYIWKTLWPVDLSVLYPHPAYAGAEPWSGVSVAAAAALLVVLSGLVVLGRRRRYLAVGWLWYLGTLVPVIGLVQVGSQMAADRYTYVPHIGLFMLLSFGLADLLRESARPLRIAATVAAAVVLVAAGMTAHARTSEWRDSETLFTRSLEATPNAWLVRVNYAVVLLERGDTEAGEAQLRRAAELAPNAYLVQFNLGMLRATQERYSEAVDHLSRALLRRPNDTRARYPLGVSLLHLGRPQDAMVQFTILLRLDPRDAQAHENMGHTLFDLRRMKDASLHYMAAIEDEPGRYWAHVGLGRALQAQGNLIGAELEYARAVEISPDIPDANERLAEVRRLRSGAEPPGSALTSAPAVPPGPVDREEHP